MTHFKLLKNGREVYQFWESSWGAARKNAAQWATRNGVDINECHLEEY